ncbi:MAG: helix-turn-helix transcriptional regulator [Paracoccaceae bacterium]|nr:MAG: helix-turn-helix transcriptional regulator [Paracoccaceae bacterium]
MVTGRPVIIAILAVQGLCAVFFVGDVLSSVLSLRSTPLSWRTREMLEIGAALGLVLGLVLGGLALHRTARGRAAAEARLRRAGIAFRDLLAERFDGWGLTPAEADVATFAIKGMSTAEIAALRGVAEGTVKAQTAAIYRKAGVTGRGQLLALFIEDMMRDDAGPPG